MERREVGTIGDVGTFSCQASKPLSAGEGRLVLTDDDILAEEGELLHNIGRVPKSSVTVTTCSP